MGQQLQDMLEVDRRIGGLETVRQAHLIPQTVNRRIGGLEMLMLWPHC